MNLGNLTNTFENNTNLIPSVLYGMGNNDNVSIQITPGGITLGGDLNTPTPITATISQAGIITDNPDGFDILSKLNMNDQDITHSGNIILESGSGNSITFSDNTIQTTAYTGSGGEAILSAGTVGDPQVFTGFNVFDNYEGIMLFDTISSNDIQLQADGVNTSQLDVLGSIGVGNAINGNLTRIRSDDINGGQLDIDGSLLICNTDNPPNTVLLSTNTTDQQLDVGGAISVGNNLYMNNYDIDSIREAKFDDGIALTDSSTNSITSVPLSNTIRLTSLSGVYVNTTSLDNGDGTIYGTASKASTIAITDSSSLVDTYYPTFVSGSGEGLTLRNDSDLTYNPSTNTLSAVNFNGTISTATNATNATNTYVQTTTDSVNHYLNFSANAVDGYAAILKNPTTLTCNPATSTITATTFSGNATTATTATNATNVNITSDGATTTACYVPFVKTIGTGNKPLFIDDTAPTFTFTPNIGQVSCTSSRANTFLSGTGSDLTITNTTLGNKIVFNTSSGPIVQCCTMEGTGLVMTATKTISAANTAGAELILAVPNATGNLSFTGTNIQSATSGGNSGQHLRIKLNGTFYKIALQNDT